MIKRWIFYLLALICCLVFFTAYQGWVAWILLSMVALLPLMSLLLSLPLFFLSRPELQLPKAVTAGDELPLAITFRGFLPLPPHSCRCLVNHSISGDSISLKNGELLPTDHCGHLVCAPRDIYFYDLLGMFRLRRNLPAKILLIRPKPLATKPPQELERQMAQSWKPKYGGGFAENHELRLYRPGDSFNQVHWKLSAKTGKLIVREPMIPACGSIRLTTDLNGTPEEVDRKLGRLLWLSQYLLDRQTTFDIRIQVGAAIENWSITNEAQLQEALDDILLNTPADKNAVPPKDGAASWQIHIGGDADEA